MSNYEIYIHDIYSFLCQNINIYFYLKKMTVFKLNTKTNPHFLFILYKLPVVD